jgi:hypothetical protein
MMYFSDGTTVQTFGNMVTINNQTTEVAQSNVAAGYQAGQAIGAAIGFVIADVRQRRKFDRVCDVNPYAWGWMWNGSPGFCSQAGIRDVCSNIANIDFDGFKYTGDLPRRLLGDAEGGLWYFSDWPARLGDKGTKCILDEAAHSTHLAQLWLTHKHEAEYYLRDSHPHLSQDDSARIVNYIYTHPDAYKGSKITARMFEKLYVAVKATS